MSNQEELPEDLSEDMEVLFIKPYSEDDMLELHATGNTDQALLEIFNRITADDPGLNRFLDIVDAVKQICSLKGYIVADDLVLLYGEKPNLDRAKKAIDEHYTSFFDTVGNFMEENEAREAAKPEIKKPLLN